MEIGIIGAGNIGQTLARGFAGAGHHVTLANSRGPETLQDVVEAIPGKVDAGTVEEAAESADVVVLAVPFGVIGQLPAASFGDRLVIDATNYYPDRDGHVASLDDHSVTSSEVVAQALSGAQVVKSFNAMRWDHLRDYGHAAGSQKRYGIPLSGDDTQAKITVMALIESLGFEPVDAGALADGHKHEPGSAVYTADLAAVDLRTALGVS